MKVDTSIVSKKKKKKKIDTSICIGYLVKWQNLSAIPCYIVYSYIANEFIGNLDQNKTFHHLWNLALEDNTV